MPLSREWDQKITQAAVAALNSRASAGEKTASSNGNESATRSNPTAVVVDCRSIARSSNGFLLATMPIPIAMRMSSVPIQKQALDAVTNASPTALGCEPEPMVNTITAGGIARISRWFRTGDRRIERRVGPGPWLTTTSRGAESLEDVEAVSHTQKG